MRVVGWAGVWDGWCLEPWLWVPAQRTLGQAAYEADLTLSSQRVAVCSSDPVQPIVAREGRDGFPEA